LNLCNFHGAHISTFINNFDLLWHLFSLSVYEHLFLLLNTPFGISDRHFEISRGFHRRPFARFTQGKQVTSRLYIGSEHATSRSLSLTLRQDFGSHHSWLGPTVHVSALFGQQLTMLSDGPQVRVIHFVHVLGNFSTDVFQSLSLNFERQRNFCYWLLRSKNGLNTISLASTDRKLMRKELFLPPLVRSRFWWGQICIGGGLSIQCSLLCKIHFL
jgi:hypothetical protein